MGFIYPSNLIITSLKVSKSNKPHFLPLDDTSVLSLSLSLSRSFFPLMKSEFNFVVISNSHAFFFLLSHYHTFLCHFWTNTIITIPTHFPTHLYLFYIFTLQIGTLPYFILLLFIFFNSNFFMFSGIKLPKFRPFIITFYILILFWIKILESQDFLIPFCSLTFQTSIWFLDFWIINYCIRTPVV